MYCTHMQVNHSSRKRSATAGLSGLHAKISVSRRIEDTGTDWMDSLTDPHTELPERRTGQGCLCFHECFFLTVFNCMSDHMYVWPYVQAHGNCIMYLMCLLRTHTCSATVLVGTGNRELKKPCLYSATRFNSP